MAPLTVLSDKDVRSLLLSLTRDDIETLQESLAEALRVYSTGTQDETACSSNQPHRASIRLKNGATTLFMPAATCDGSAGIKMVTISETGKDVAGEPASSGASVTSASGSVSRSASSSTTAVDAASTVSAAPGGSIASSQSTTPRGTLTLLHPSGTPRALVNAEEVTAFRTALAATMLLKRREHVQTVTVFGAGKQAYWHIRLSLLLRGADIKRVNIINRSFGRAQPLLQEFYSDEFAAWRAQTKFSVLSSEYGEYERVLKDEVRKADVIFCCTPSTTPLFPAEYLTAHEGRKKGRLVSAIGSYRPHMCELHPDILRQAVSPHHHNHHHHKHAASSGVVVVDSLSACLKEAGEIIQAGLGPDQLVEVGELIMLEQQSLARRRSSHRANHRQSQSPSHDRDHGKKHHLHLPFLHKKRSLDRHQENGTSQPSPADGTSKENEQSPPPLRSTSDLNPETKLDKTKESGTAENHATAKEHTRPTRESENAEEEEEDDGMTRWLTRGNVIYKSVGLGLMDVVVGGDLVTFARDRGVGTLIEDF